MMTRRGSARMSSKRHPADGRWPAGGLKSPGRTAGVGPLVQIPQSASARVYRPGSMQTGGLPKATRQAQNGRAPVSMESGMFESEIMKPRSGFARLNQVKLPLWVTLVLLIVFLGLFAAREFTLRGREDRVNDERRAVAQQLEVEQAARRASTRHV